MLINRDEAIAAMLAAGYEGSQGEAIVGIGDAVAALRAMPAVSVSEEMVERAARAMCWQDTEIGSDCEKACLASSKCLGEGVAHYRREARTALDAALGATVSDGWEDIERETLESMILWGDETFGPCTQDRAISRAWEEWQEMLEKGADVPIEASDVIICLLRIPGILEAINRKMAINRKRTWDVRPDGTGYHVKAALGPLPAPPSE